MSFFTVDDQMYGHDKTLALCKTAAGRQAMGLWAVAGSWCGGHPDTHGHITLERIRTLGFTKKHAETLEAGHFWDKTAEGWAFHNWAERRPNDKALTKTRKDGAERQRNFRKRQKDNALRDDVTEKGANALPGPVRTVPILTDPDRNVTAADACREYSDASAHTYPLSANRDAFGAIASQANDYPNPATLLREVTRYFWRPDGWAQKNGKARPAGFATGFHRDVKEMRGEVVKADAVPMAPYHRPFAERPEVDAIPCPAHLLPGARS